MDESGIEATQALDFVDDGDETDEDIDPNAPVIKKNCWTINLCFTV